MDVENEQLYSACRAEGSLEQVDAFERLWSICYRAVYAMIHAQPDADALASDCAQTALIKIHRNLDQCQQPTRFTSWAAQVARRVALDELRRPSHRLRADLDAADHLSDATDVAATVTSGDLATLLVHAIVNSGLSERSQRVVRGRYFREEPDEVLAAAERALGDQIVAPNHIQVTRSKNMAKLRGNKTLLERLRDELAT